MPDNSGYEAETHMEPRVECPYCGKETFSRSYYGHVSMTSGNGHGERGEIPEDFKERTPEVVGHAPFTMKVAKNLPEGTRLRCKHCGDSFDGWHGLKTHLAMMANDDEHPEGATAEGSAVRVTEQESSITEEGGADTQQPDHPAAAQQESPLDAYRSKLESYRDGTNDPNQLPASGAVPVEVLLELLDEMRESEGQAGGFYKSAKMLEQVIRQYSTDEGSALEA